MQYLQSTMEIFNIKHYIPKAHSKKSKHLNIYNYDVSNIGILEMKTA